MRRFFVVATTLLLTIPPTYAQEGYLERSIARELKILQSFTKADDETLKTIQSAVVGATKEMDTTEIVMGFLPPAIYDGIVAAAERELRGDPTLSDYQTDLRLRREFKRQVSAAIFMLQLNRAVQLRTDQWDRAQKLADELAIRNAIPVIEPIRNIERCKQANRRLREFLTAEQFALWRKNAPTVRIGGVTNVDYKGDAHQRTTKLKAELQNIAVAKTAWLRDEFKLTAAQTRKLQVAAKGAISGLVERRIAVEVPFVRMFTGRGGPVNFFTDDAKLAMADPSMLLSHFSRWRRLIRSVLDDDQEAALQKVVTRRARFEQGVYKTLAVVTLSRDMALNGKQLNAFRNLAIEATPASDPNKLIGFYDGIRELAEIDDNKFTAAIGEDNWASLMPLLETVKASLGAAGADTEDAED